ncbi:hypothetical protein EYF80_007859 [Liparis tanakae]|uniref:Uncharacterized protein n=1 Tax=Liparis tanakae TaxID=230148 RepID=A0A4Z2IVU2_9TELE|nr:hypothetical protein EYF80_007859 [Liparis tanakae]
MPRLNGSLRLPGVLPAAHIDQLRFPLRAITAPGPAVESVRSGCAQPSPLRAQQSALLSMSPSLR